MRVSSALTGLALAGAEADGVDDAVRNAPADVDADASVGVAADARVRWPARLIWLWAVKPPGVDEMAETPMVVVNKIREICTRLEVSCTTGLPVKFPKNTGTTRCHLRKFMPNWPVALYT